MDFIYEIIFLVNNYIEYNYTISIILYFSLLVIFFTFSLPGTTVAVMSSGFLFGFFFGFFLGFIINIFAISIGSLFFVLFSKSLFQKLFKKNFIKYSSKISHLIKNSSFEYLILLRLIIGPPLIVQNICLSLMNGSKIKIFVSTFVGFIPIIGFLSYIGSYLNNILDLKKIKFDNLISMEFLLILFFLIFLLLLRIYLKKN